MFALKPVTVLFFMIIPVSHCQRRIKDGVDVTIDRKYMAYLIKADRSELEYDFWLCGGAIVKSDFVITSAACVHDVEYIYVIAGYNKYITDDKIESDKCTSEMKKKAIYTCTPKGYELKYGELDYWSHIDIALVKVDTPFNFEDQRYETLCSYKPTTIAINYEEKYQEPGTDALVLGWGHTTGWRQPGDTKNYNEETLKYAPTLLMNKSTCIEHFLDYKNMSMVINGYMICSLGKGNINDAGNTILENLPLQNGCTAPQQKLMGFEGVSCEEQDSKSEDSYDEDATRRHNRGSNKTNNASVSDFNATRARRNGICQNDHGGPLVTWAGSREILIGVASVFKVAENLECMGPYLYTSTLCTGMFLDCTLNSDEFPETRRSNLCDRPAKERGYDLIERTISWKDYPGGSGNDDNIGRMPIAKISAGLKYLTHNNKPPQQSNLENVTKYESSNMYSDTKNPAIISNAPKERLKIKDSYPENKRVSGEENGPVSNGQPEESKYESNKMYLAAKSPAIVSAYKERFQIKDRYPEKKNISGMGTFPIINRSPEKQNFPVNDRHPGKPLYPGIERYPVNNRYPANQSPSANQKYPITRRNPVTERYPETARYRVSVGVINKHMIVPSKIAVRPQHPLRN